MNILHLFSDWKWTGPAEPVLSLCQELTQRGHNITFAYRRPPKPVERSIAAFVGEFQVVATDQFRLNRYFSVFDNVRDVMDLRRFVREKKIEVVHTHLTHDHALAAFALLTPGPSAPVLVRSDHKRDSISPSPGNRFLLRRAHGIVSFSERARSHLIDRFGLSPERVRKVNPAIDTDRFDPENLATARVGPAAPSPGEAGATALRRKWGLADTDIAVGTVARFQKYRKTDLLLHALKRAIPRAPSLKAILIGRSSQINQTVHKPVLELGLQDHVVAAGYLTDRYLEGLASLDAFVFLIAGSDGTGRALREAMAMGKAVIVNNVGMLPEMIEEGQSGLIFNDTVEDLAEQLVRVARDEALRKRLGQAARHRARQEFSLSRQADAVETFYRHLATNRSSPVP